MLFLFTHRPRFWDVREKRDILTDWSWAHRFTVRELTPYERHTHSQAHRHNLQMEQVVYMEDYDGESRSAIPIFNSQISSLPWSPTKQHSCYILKPFTRGCRNKQKKTCKQQISIFSSKDKAFCWPAAYIPSQGYSEKKSCIFELDKSFELGGNRIVWFCIVFLQAYLW